MLIMRNKSNVIHILSVAYITLPAVLFCANWLNTVFGIILSLLFLALAFMLCKEYTTQQAALNIDKKYIVAVLAIVLIWVYFSGIGGYSFQNGDYYVRNPIWRDLYTQPWPITYDMANQSEIVQNICGKDKVAFVYYFAFWLPPAAISKLLCAGEMLSNIILYLWAVLGVLLVVLETTIYVKQCKLAFLIIFIAFSGIDILPYIVRAMFEHTLSIANLAAGHKEWWAGGFQYSSNTTLLYWVFNQAIPIWLITALLLNLQSNWKSLALCSLAFLYSPFATFGIIPLAVASVFIKNRKWKDAITFLNIIVPVVVFVVWRSFYLSNSGSVSVNGFIWNVNKDSYLLLRYIVFIAVEIGIYFIIIRHKLKSYDYLAVAIASLLLLPVYKITPANDFVMRSSIPALFILTLSCIRFYLEEPKSHAKRLLVITLLLGVCNPASEIIRSLYNTARGITDNQEFIYSFANIRSTEENWIRICNRQFFAHNYKDTFFFKYIGRTNTEPYTVEIDVFPKKD